MSSEVYWINVTILSAYGILGAIFFVYPIFVMRIYKNRLEEKPWASLCSDYTPAAWLFWGVIIAGGIYGYYVYTGTPFLVSGMKRDAAAAAKKKRVEQSKKQEEKEDVLSIGVDSLLAQANDDDAVLERAKQPTSPDYTLVILD